MPPSLALSTCWNSQQHKDGYQMLLECAELGFESVELGHGTRYSLWPGILKAHEEKIIKIGSLHNFCPLPMGFTKPAPNCFEFSDPNSKRRKRALKHTRETIDHAAFFGAKAIVLHLGSTGQLRANPQLESWFADGNFGTRKYAKTKVKAVIDHEKATSTRWPWVEEILEELTAYAHQKEVLLGFECRESIEEIPLDDKWEAILDKFPQGAGYWHDFGHAARKDCLGFTDQVKQFEKNSSRLIGCHLHDFLPPKRDHIALGDGKIPYSLFWPKLKTNPLFVLELSPRVPKEKVQACLKWWKKNGPQ